METPISPISNRRFSMPGVSVLRPALDRGVLDAEDVNVVLVFFGPGTSGGEDQWCD